MAKAHDLNIYKYIVYLLEKRPNIKMDDDTLESMAPWNEKVKDHRGNNVW